MTETHYQQNREKIAERRIHDEVVLLPITSELGAMGQMLDLNATATRIWDLAREGASESEIAKVLVDEFDAPEPEIRADVRAVLDHLTTVGALLKSE